MSAADRADVLRRILESRVADIETVGPGVVHSYDAATRTADVRPMTKRPIADEDDEIQHEELPIVPSCPVIFPGSGAFRITFPIKKGDGGALIHLKWSAAKWRSGDGSKPTEPGDVRMHHLGAAIFLPGWDPDTIAIAATSEDAMVLVTDAATELRLRAHDATDKLTNDTKLQIELGKISAAIEALKTAVTTLGGSGGPGYAAPGATAFEKIKGKD
jgi:hypothetical protein